MYKCINEYKKDSCDNEIVYKKNHGLYYKSTTNSDYKMKLDEVKCLKTSTTVC